MRYYAVTQRRSGICVLISEHSFFCNWCHFRSERLFLANYMEDLIAPDFALNGAIDCSASVYSHYNGGKLFVVWH